MRDFVNCTMLLTREIEFEKGAEILAHFVGFPACQQHKSTGSDLVLFLVNNSDLCYIILYDWFYLSSSHKIWFVHVM